MLAALLIMALSSSVADVSAPQPADWIARAEITVIRFAPAASGGADPAFVGRPESCRHTLSTAERDALAQFLVRVNTRERREEAEAQREGKVTGGVPGCIGHEFGVSFATSQRSVNTYFSPRCGWLFTAEPRPPGPEPLRFVFTQVELAWLSAFMERHVGCAK